MYARIGILQEDRKLERIERKERETETSCPALQHAPHKAQPSIAQARAIALLSFRPFLAATMPASPATRKLSLLRAAPLSKPARIASTARGRLLEICDGFYSPPRQPEASPPLRYFVEPKEKKMYVFTYSGLLIAVARSGT